MTQCTYWAFWALWKDRQERTRKQQPGNGLQEKMNEFESAWRDPSMQNRILLQLANELNIENGLFLQAVSKFKAEYGKNANDRRFREVQAIVRSFISNSAEFQVNIPGNLRESITSQVGDDRSSENKIPIELFNEAANEVKLPMLDGTFARVCKTKEYIEWKTGVDPKSKHISLMIFKSS